MLPQPHGRETPAGVRWAAFTPVPARFWLAGQTRLTGSPEGSSGDAYLAVHVSDDRSRGVVDLGGDRGTGRAGTGRVGGPGLGAAVDLPAAPAGSVPARSAHRRAPHHA